MNTAAQKYDTLTLVPAQRPHVSDDVDAEPGRVLDFDAWRTSGVLDTSHLDDRPFLSYSQRNVLSDCIIIVSTSILAVNVRFGDLTARLSSNDQALTVTYRVVALLSSFVWMSCLASFGCWSAKIRAEGPAEFRRLAAASATVFTIIVTVAYLLNVQVARGFLLLSLPLAMACMVLSRLILRFVLQRRWLRGVDVTGVLVVGGPISAIVLADQFRRTGHCAYRVTGMCVPGGSRTEAPALGAVGAGGGMLAGIPVVGGLSDVVDAVRLSRASVVAIAPTDGFGPREVRNLSWSLEGTGVRLVLAPALADVAEPRLRLRKIAGLPLMHVEEVKLGGLRLRLKTVVDMVLAITVLIVASPVMLAIAVAVKADGGPVFFRQKRVGLRGEAFRMWKFRSMVVNAESMVDQLRDRSEGNGILFKIKDDPRITRVGKFLRKTSLDEIPQLFNVLAGSMSLVGPRPPLLREVAKYDSEVYRKLLVKPGMTGLWQVSGRSEIEWEESVRLDLYYVENWSLINDLVILCQTVKVMVSRRGAY